MASTAGSARKISRTAAAIASPALAAKAAAYSQVPSDLPGEAVPAEDPPGVGRRPFRWGVLDPEGDDRDGEQPRNHEEKEHPAQRQAGPDASVVARNTGSSG